MEIAMELVKGFMYMVVLLILQIYNTAVMAEDDSTNPKWSYIDTQDDGPQHWAEIGYPSCGGDMQSPILLNITKDYDGPFDTESEKVKFMQYGEIKGLILENTGTAVLLNLPDDLESNDRPYTEKAGVNSKCYLKELRFHFGDLAFSGTEHNITYEGEGYERKGREMELQALHECPEEENTKLISLAFKFDTSFLDNPPFDPIVKNLPEIRYAGTKKTIEEPIDLSEISYMSTSQRHFIRYTGSLTYPPCTEGIIWTVYEDPIHIATSQINAFKELYRTTENAENQQYLYGNIRPVQERNGRKIDVFRLGEKNPKPCAYC